MNKSNEDDINTNANTIFAHTVLQTPPLPTKQKCCPWNPDCSPVDCPILPNLENFDTYLFSQGWGRFRKDVTWILDFSKLLWSESFFVCAHRLRMCNKKLILCFFLWWFWYHIYVLAWWTCVKYTKSYRNIDC